jgi:hypothetical protein
MRVLKFMAGFTAAVACLAAAGAATTANAAKASPAEDPGTRVLIRNVNSGKCVAVPGGTTTPKTQLVQWPCGPFNPDNPDEPYSPEKMWNIIHDENGWLYFQNVKTKQCLTSRGGNGGPVMQNTCSFFSDQSWYYYATGSKRLWNLSTRDCMAVPAAQTGDGVRLIHWTCGNGDEQKWQISYLT